MSSDSGAEKSDVVEAVTALHYRAETAVCDDESVRPFPDAGSGRELPVGSNLTPAVTDAAEGASEQE